MLSTSHFLAFGFLNAGFAVAGAALIAIPIIIHLLNRRRFRTMTWAAMEFLLRAMRKNRRRLKFEQWLLLATRCLLLALLGMALARPLGCENSAVHAFGRHTALNVFVIDNGYSSGYEANHPDAKTHLDQAKRLMKAILSRPTSGGESVVVITADRPASPIIRAQTDMQSAILAVDRIEQSNGATDLAGALQHALKIAREEDTQPNKNLFIISAGARSSWEGRQSLALQQLGPELATQFKITHYNLSDGPQWNGAVLDIKPNGNLVNTKYSASFVADVKGFGPTHDGTLQWKLDDELLPKAGGSVKLDAAAGAQVLNDVSFSAGGPHVLTAELIDNDKLGLDNTRWRIVDVASELKVLVVEGRRGISPVDGSAEYLATALEPKFADPRERHSSYISTEVISDLELGTKVLGDYSCVALAGVGQITAAEADSLEKYVKQGGSLVLFMGPEVSKENYNTLLLPRKLMPGPLVKLMSTGVDQQPYNFAFNPKGLLHPYLHDFADQTDSGLDKASIMTYWQVDISPTSPVERVLNYKATDANGKGDAAITVQSLGEGRVVFDSTSPASDDWSALPVHPAYVPLMTALVSGSVRTGDWWLNREVGQIIEIPSTVRLSTAPTLTDSKGTPLVIDPEMQDGRVVYRTPPMRKPGLYTLSLGDRKFPIAVNVPAAEVADVTVITDDAIRKALGDINMSLLKADVSAEGHSVEEGNDFSWWTMMIVLGLVGFECFIAMRFGHYRQSLIGTPGNAAGAGSSGTRTAGAPLAAGAVR